MDKNKLQEPVTIYVPQPQSFDTHYIVKSFIKTGFREDQAEAITQAIAQSKDFDLSNLATKVQVTHLEKVTKEQISNLEKSTKEQISNLKEQIANLEIFTKEQITNLEKSTKEQISNLEMKIEHLREDMEKKMAANLLTIELKIERHANTMIKWVIGVNSATVGVIFAILKLIG